MVELFANSGDTDQMPHSVASDLGLHYLPIILLGTARLQWVNNTESPLYLLFQITTKCFSLSETWPSKTP